MTNNDLGYEAGTFVVYGLVDPRDPQRLRYVGATNDPARRYYEHAVKRSSVRLNASGLLDDLDAAGLALGMRILSAHRSREAALREEWRTVKARRGSGDCDLNGRIAMPASMAADRVQDFHFFAVGRFA